MSKLDLLSRKQLLEEEKVISSLKVCNVPNEGFNIDTFRDDLAKAQLENDFHNPALLAVLFCLLDSVVHIPTTNHQSYEDATAYLHDLFTNMRQIGADSENGNALLVGMKSTEDVIVAKSPKSKLNDELYHEYFIGVSTLNNLRIKTPNFAYILGAFKCLPPHIDADKKVREWCEANGINEPNNLVNYVLYEKSPGRSVEDMIPSVSALEVFSWFIQIAISLHVAKRSKFTHYDLHTGNVIARTWKDKKYITIPYVTSDKGDTLYVHTQHVVQVIDYGMSSVVFEDKPYGKHEMEHAGVYFDRYRPMFDLYKFFGYALIQMLATNRDEGRKLIPVWAVMNKLLLGRDLPVDMDNLIAELEEQADNYMILSIKPLASEESVCIMTLFEALKKNNSILSMWSKVVSAMPPQDNSLLGCGDVCPVKTKIEATLLGNTDMDVCDGMDPDCDIPLSDPTMLTKVKKLRRDLSQACEEVASMMQSQINFSFGDVPDVVTSRQYADFLSDHVEPSIDIIAMLRRINKMRRTLTRYYKKSDKQDHLAEFDFDEVQEEWQAHLNLLREKMTRMKVPARRIALHEDVKHMLDM